MKLTGLRSLFSTGRSHPITADKIANTLIDLKFMRWNPNPAPAIGEVRIRCGFFEVPRTPSGMPRISEFFGIVINMYYRDHHPPHFHALHAESEAEIEIETLAILGGGLPPGPLRKVLLWAGLHRDELLENWDLARLKLPLKPIAPLR